MTTPKRQLDRLMPRHEVRPPRPAVEWDVQAPRRFRKTVEPSPAEVVDISLEGALLEVPADDQHTDGDIVTIRLDGLEGKVRIKHRQAGDGPATQHYGVVFIDAENLRALIDEVVARARGNHSAVREAWESKRR